jgi:hypothetical protein
MVSFARILFGGCNGRHYYGKQNGSWVCSICGAGR